MSKFTKIVGLIYLIGICLLVLLAPISAICLLAKLVGAPMTWAVACIPIFIAFGVAAPVLISKVLIDYLAGAN